MGSACQKQLLEFQHSQSDDFLDLIQPVSRETTMARIHHKHQKILHKHKLASLSREDNVQSLHLIECDNHQNQSTLMKSTTQEQSDLQNAKEYVEKKKEQKPKNLKQGLREIKAKEPNQDKQIKSSLRSISFQHATSHTQIPVRGQSEKHVRFKLPKSKKYIKSEKKIKRLKTRVNESFFQPDSQNFIHSRLLNQ